VAHVQTLYSYPLGLALIDNYYPLTWYQPRFSSLPYSHRLPLPYSRRRRSVPGARTAPLPSHGWRAAPLLPSPLFLSAGRLPWQARCRRRSWSRDQWCRRRRQWGLRGPCRRCDCRGWARRLSWPCGQCRRRRGGRVGPAGRPCPSLPPPLPPLQVRRRWWQGRGAHSRLPCARAGVGGRAHRRRWGPHHCGHRFGPCGCGRCDSRGDCRSGGPSPANPPVAGRRSTSCRRSAASSTGRPPGIHRRRPHRCPCGARGAIGPFAGSDPRVGARARRRRRYRCSDCRGRTAPRLACGPRRRGHLL
jgi:hypothetical protein